MRFYKEKIEMDLLIPAKIYLGNTKGEKCHYPLHWHNDLEFVLVLSGEIKGRINNREMKVSSGELFFVNSGELHETEANDKNTINAITIQLSYELLKKYCSDIDYYYFDLKDNELKEKIKKLIIKSAHIYAKKEEFYELELSLILMELSQILLKQCRKKRKVNSIYIHEGKSETNVKKSITYMEEHYDADLSLKDIAGEVGMAPTYFSRFFKKNTGETVYGYLNKIRLYYSYKELLSTENSITEIALNNGFANVKSFIEIFKKTYMSTPAKYRNEFMVKMEKDNN